MAFLELFDKVTQHVESLGIEVGFERGRPLADAEIYNAQQRVVIPIPDSVAALYAEVGDGFEFWWNSDDENAPFAAIEFADLEMVTFESLGPLDFRLKWDDGYSFSGTDDPALAKRTARRMRDWLPFYMEGNGDLFCLDTSIDPAPVIYDKHDWADGGTGDNGFLMGNTLYEFFESWSRVCFQFPRSVHWPGVIGKNGEGVDWNSAEFRKPFRIA